MTPATTDWTWWLEVSKATISAITPLVTLGGAIYLYYRKQADDRREALRKDRAFLYSNYLTAYANAINGDSGEDYVRRIYHVTNAIRPYHEQLVIHAPASVVLASWDLIRTYIDPDVRRNIEGLDRQPKDEEFVAEVMAQTQARRMLAEEMRKDALGASAPEPELPRDKMVF